MRIIDSQVHVWGANTHERPWPARAHAHRAIPLSAGELLRDMGAAGVDGAIIVPPSWEGDRNDLAIEAARAHSDRFAIMGRFDPDAPDARELITRWKDQPGMLGLRFSFHTPILRQPFVDGRFDWVWAPAERAGLPVMVLVHYAYMDKMDSIAERHPGLKLVIDHLGLINGTKDEEAFRDLDKLLALAKRPNVAVKSSALPCYTEDAYPYKRLHPWMRKVHDAFGSRRMFWGTDISRSPCSYRQNITMFTEEIPWLASEDKEWIMGRGLCEWLRWKRREK